ncbi:MAG: hypothetical protein HQL40_02385 [Alphaproteobacteria bacterium]|nr:hypothetical protein [Alphaproteobacteria bacterium]
MTDEACEGEDDAVQSMQTEMAYFLLFSFMTGMGLFAASAQVLMGADTRRPDTPPPVLVTTREKPTEKDCYWKDKEFPASFLYVLVDQSGIKVRRTVDGGPSGHFADSVRSRMETPAAMVGNYASAGGFDKSSPAGLTRVLDRIGSELGTLADTVRERQGFTCRLQVTVGVAADQVLKPSAVPKTPKEFHRFEVVRCAGGAVTNELRTWCSQEARPL